MNTYHMINECMKSFEKDERYYKTVEGLKEVQERLANYLPDSGRYGENSVGYLGEMWEISTDYICPFNADTEVTASLNMGIFYDRNTCKITAKKWVALSYESEGNCFEEKEIGMSTYQVENMTDYQVLMYYPFFQQFIRVLRNKIGTAYVNEYESLNKSKININTCKEDND